MKKLSILLILALALSACSNEEKETQSSLRDQLIGEWQNLSIKVTMNQLDSIANPDVYEVDTTNWEKELQIKPIITTFNADSTYTSVYRALNDSVLGVLKGRWGVIEDTLLMLPQQNSQPSKYFTKIDGNQAEFTTLLDWDSDGEEDDLYIGIQEKVIR